MLGFQECFELVDSLDSHVCGGYELLVATKLVVMAIYKKTKQKKQQKKIE
eukprot:m.174104 g.174104  ORF g.174104 m.174104 type:complete len:50 (-) comp16536_c1_seq6:2739-2888(-)